MNTTIKKILIAITATLFVTQAFASGGGGAPVTKMIIGDSIFALSGDIRDFLEEDLGESIDNYARSGCQVLGGSFLCSTRSTIPNQYARADKDGIRTVIMNGGANDYLLGDAGDCRTDECAQEAAAEIERALQALFAEIQADGIDQIIFLGYYDVRSSSGNNEGNDLSAQYKIATYPGLGVKYIDTRAAMAQSSRYISADGLHPSRAGSRVLADLIIEALNEF